MSKFDYFGTDIYYTLFGDGEVTLFLHGWGCDSSVFAKIANSVAGKKLLVDFPPFGKSGALNDVWCVETYTNMIKKLIKYLDIGTYNIVAHSFGCRVAIMLAESDKVKKLVITGGAGIKDKSIFTKYKIYKYKILKLACKLKLVNRDKLSKYGSSDYKKLSGKARETFCNIVNCDLTKKLTKIKSETLLLWGENDDAVPIKYAKIMRRKIKNSELYIYKGCGHFVFIENEVAFSNAINQFFK